MAKRRPAKKKASKPRSKKSIPKKKPLKSSNKRIIKTSTKRGSNIIKFHVGGKPENVAKRLDSKELDSKLNYRITKNKPVKGAGYKPPKAVVVIYEVKNEDGETKVFSEISEPDFVVNSTNTKEFIKNQTEKAEETFNSNKDSSGGGGNIRIKSVSIKFVY